VRYIPLPQAPRNRGFTLLLAVLWAALVLYILTHPTLAGIIILVVFTLFIVPMFILAFRLRQMPDEDPPAAPDDSGELTPGKNGHARL